MYGELPSSPAGFLEIYVRWFLDDFLFFRQRFNPGNRGWRTLCYWQTYSEGKGKGTFLLRQGIQGKRLKPCRLFEFSWSGILHRLVTLHQGHWNSMNTHPCITTDISGKPKEVQSKSLHGFILHRCILPVIEVAPSKHRCSWYGCSLLKTRKALTLPVPKDFFPKLNLRWHPADSICAFENTSM